MTEIFTILENVSFGKHFFETAMLLRNSLLVNSVLVNAEVWYNLKDNDIEELNVLDKLMFSRLFSIPKSSPFVSYFLENGILDFESIIKMRRVIYFQNLLKRKKESLIYSFLMVQIHRSTHLDWTGQVFKDPKDLNIDSSIKNLQEISHNSFKTS